METMKNDTAQSLLPVNIQVVVVDTIPKLRLLRQDLLKLKPFGIPYDESEKSVPYYQQKHIQNTVAFDAEWCDETLCLLQLALISNTYDKEFASKNADAPPMTVYLIDMLTFLNPKEIIYSSAQDEERAVRQKNLPSPQIMRELLRQILGPILSNKMFRKVCFDCREDCEKLRCFLHLTPRGCYDLQLLEVRTREYPARMSTSSKKKENANGIIAVEESYECDKGGKMRNDQKQRLLFSVESLSFLLGQLSKTNEELAVYISAKEALRCDEMKGKKRTAIVGNVGDVIDIERKSTETSQNEAVTAESVKRRLSRANFGHEFAVRPLGSAVAAYAAGDVAALFPLEQELKRRSVYQENNNNKSLHYNNKIIDDDVFGGSTEYETLASRVPAAYRRHNMLQIGVLRGLEAIHWDRQRGIPIHYCPGCTREVSFREGEVCVVCKIAIRRFNARAQSAGEAHVPESLPDKKS